MYYESDGKVIGIFQSFTALLVFTQHFDQHEMPFTCEKRIDIDSLERGKDILIVPIHLR
jgi:hypothetical protein